MVERNLDAQLRALTRRYTGTTLEALVAVLCPLLIPIRTIDAEITKRARENHYHASFTVEVTEDNHTVLQRGRTGKFVPAAFGDGRVACWREIAKGRIVDVDESKALAFGEVYVGSGRRKLERALEELTEADYLEIDQYGAAAKVLSGLAEYHLVEAVQASGYNVRRMPEDMAQHLGAYANYDFEFEKDRTVTKVEVKSIWGTDTDCARLIHSTTTRPNGPQSSWTDSQRRNYYATSSCKFATQDVFAVSLFLRTGDIRDFAFARSVPNDEKPYGLPRAAKYPEHVSQNPECEVGDGVWFGTIDEVLMFD